MLATRRALGALTRHFRSLHLATFPLQEFRTSIFQSFTPFGYPPMSNLLAVARTTQLCNRETRRFSSRQTSTFDGEEDEEDDSEGEVEESFSEEGGSEGSTKRVRSSGKSEAEKLQEAAAIGYKVVGPLTSSENPFKPYEPVFAVVQVGSHQFKVSNGDSIFTERLKYCEVNDKLILNKVLLLGSRTETIIGRPILPDAAVHAIVEEHALDAKVIIFKKKRRKNYRRTKGHRQELTKLRITDIQGIDKSETLAVAA
ncbi:hypothetical protein HPP92_024321 [Vanilla planifolia]|uniref:Large ribosomal subunit protein bL21m n=1 Tax=Vanilla planifolia TaxID=51239 RepID=A0A835UCU6_VANPL|nr:hypothetical protein HPP92_024321 [Vanilla planifolia]